MGCRLLSIIGTTKIQYVICSRSYDMHEKGRIGSMEGRSIANGGSAKNATTTNADIRIALVFINQIRLIKCDARSTLTEFTPTSM